MTEPTRSHDDPSFRAVLAKVEAVRLDVPGVRLSFSARLARENGWTDDFARRVVAEYRRFVVLAAVAGHPVTPSDQVDQAWHLHLVYSRSYWHDLCRDTLGFDLHHGPTAGGAGEGAKYRDWYQRTLESYRHWFGTEPPSDIWPVTRDRFADADRFRRVNEASHWVIRKPSMPTFGGTKTLGVATVAALTLTGCLAAGGTGRVLGSADAGSDRTIAAIIFVAILAALAIGVIAALRRTRSRGRTGRGGTDAAAYPLIFGDDGGGADGTSHDHGSDADSGCSGCSGCGGCGS